MSENFSRRGLLCFGAIESGLILPLASVQQIVEEAVKTEVQPYSTWNQRPYAHPLSAVSVNGIFAQAPKVSQNSSPG